MKKILFFLFIALSVAITGYIVQINSTITLAYSIAHAKKQLKQLQETHNTVETNKAKDFSLRNAAILALELHFEKVDTISYVQVLTKSVAKQTNSVE